MPQVALLATMLLLATCYALVSNAVRIFKKFVRAPAWIGPATHRRPRGLCERRDAARAPRVCVSACATSQELREGEVVRFGDFLRALPKADEIADEEYDEEEMTDPQKPIV